jgi:hypothetical protein
MFSPYRTRQRDLVGLGEIGHEADPGVAVTLQKFGKEVLMDERIPTLQSGNLALVVIDTDDVVTHFGETDCGNEADVSRTNDGNLNAFAHKSV